MQLHVICFWEVALVKDANSQFSPHLLALVAQEPSLQSLGFFNPPLMPRQMHWQGTVWEDTAVGSNETLAALVTSLTEQC